ncbi:MAG: hypothetical protein ABI637_10070 [Gemmatimonadota bacterium]
MTRHTPHIRTARTVLAMTAIVAVAACSKKSPTAPSNPVAITNIVPPANSGFVEARTSQIVTDGSPPSQVFDDFSFAAGGTFTKVGWQGIYCVQQPGAAAPSPTASSFTVSFYSDLNGKPNLTAPLQTTTYTVAQSGQTFEKNVSGLMCGTAANTTWPFYKYAVTLPTPFTVTAGSKYWISIQATTPSYAVYFGWRDGTVLNNLSLQLFNGVYTTYNIDRAYSLGS